MLSARSATGCAGRVPASHLLIKLDTCKQSTEGMQLARASGAEHKENMCVIMNTIGADTQWVKSDGEMIACIQHFRADMLSTGAYQLHKAP